MPTEYDAETVSQYLSSCTLNDVLAFYYELDKVSSPEERKRLRNFIGETLMEVRVFLPPKTIEQKKLEYRIPVPSLRVNPHFLFGSTQQAVSHVATSKNIDTHERYSLHAS